MSFAHPHFAEPQWLWLAILGPLALALAQRYAARARRRQLARLAAPELLGALTASHSRARRALKSALLTAALAAMGLALARPQWGEDTEVARLLGHDTLFVMDCSQSMLAADVSPSRLQRSKLAVRDYLQRYARGRVGLVAFAGQAFLQCPLTFDYNAFQETLDILDERAIPSPGTDVGRALGEAFHSLEPSRREKIVVLITDGEDLERTGVKAAEELAGKGVRVFTIGVGTSAGAQIRVTNEQGQSEWLRDRQGGVVRSRLDEAALREIARVTGGAYFPLGPAGEGLARVRLALEHLPGHDAAISRKLGVDRFHFPLAIALGLLVGESLLGTRRRTREIGGR